jgi:hypothetical protein
VDSMEVHSYSWAVGKFCLKCNFSSGGTIAAGVRDRRVTRGDPRAKVNSTRCRGGFPSRVCSEVFRKERPLDIADYLRPLVAADLNPGQPSPADESSLRSMPKTLPQLVFDSIYLEFPINAEHEMVQRVTTFHKDVVVCRAWLDRRLLPARARIGEVEYVYSFGDIRLDPPYSSCHPAQFLFVWECAIHDEVVHVCAAFLGKQWALERICICLIQPCSAIHGRESDQQTRWNFEAKYHWRGKCLRLFFLFFLPRPGSGFLREHVAKSNHQEDDDSSES